METEKVDERRKYPRFSDRILAGARVLLAPVPPLYGEPASGYLVDLSAGGMALVMSDMIPKNVFMRMTMTLPDGFKIESVISVRRVVRQGRSNDFLHGMEFLNPAPEMIDRINLLAREILACNNRTQKKSPEICVSGCALTAFCKRPQRIEKNVRPLLIELAQELKQQTDLPITTEVTAEDMKEFWDRAA